jgi:uncharacterized protein
MQIAYPFRIAHGRAKGASEEQHLRQMIEQVLFTSQGERVNRPDFGCGLQSALFQTSHSELVIALQFLVQSSLQRWLGDFIQVTEVKITAENEKLNVLVQYIRLGSSQPQLAEFTR